jgi:hypothetical protein
MYVCLPGDLALLYESWWKTRRSIIWTIAPDRRQEEKKVLFDRCVVDLHTPSATSISKRKKSVTLSWLTAVSSGTGLSRGG